MKGEKRQKWREEGTYLGHLGKERNDRKEQNIGKMGMKENKEGE